MKPLDQAKTILADYVYSLEWLDIALDHPSCDMTLEEYEHKCIEVTKRYAEALAELFGSGEIVLCRDCRYYSEYQDLCERLHPGMLVMDADGFCAWGERREQ